MNGNTNWADVGVCAVVACIFIAGFYCAYRLVMVDHPWFALAVLLVVGSISVKTGKGGNE